MLHSELNQPSMKHHHLIPLFILNARVRGKRAEYIASAIYQAISDKKLDYHTRSIWPRMIVIVVDQSVHSLYRIRVCTRTGWKAHLRSGRQAQHEMNLLKRLQPISSPKISSFVLLVVLKLTCPHSWAGASVSGCSGRIDIDLKRSQSEGRVKFWRKTHINAGISSTSVSRNGGKITSGRCSSSTACYHELCALGVPLRCICLVQSQQLMSNEIVSRSKSSWNSTRPLEVLVNNCSSPTRACKWRSGHAHLIDLEPSGWLSITGAEWSPTLIHPNHHRTLLMSPLSANIVRMALSRRKIGNSRPNGSYTPTCRNGCIKWSRGSTITSHGRVRNTKDGIVGRPLSLDSWGAWWRAVTFVSWVSNTANVLETS